MFNKLFTSNKQNGTAEEQKGTAEEQKKREELTKTIKEYALNTLEADLVGIASANDPQFSRAPKGHHPNDHVAGAKSVIVMGIRQLRDTVRSPHLEIHSKHYDLLNAKLEQMTYKMARKVGDMGYTAQMIPETDPYPRYVIQQQMGDARFSPVFCHIHAAVAAGLGKRGKLGVVLTPQYGPLQRWTTVITTADLVPDPRLIKDPCLDFIKPGSCNLCIEACPSGSLRAWPDEGGVQMHKCMFNNGKLNRGTMCAHCIASCPVGR